MMMERNKLMDTNTEKLRLVTLLEAAHQPELAPLSDQSPGEEGGRTRILLPAMEEAHQVAM